MIYTQNQKFVELTVVDLHSDHSSSVVCHLLNCLKNSRHKSKYISMISH